MYSNKELKKLLAEKLKILQQQNKLKEPFTGMGLPPLPGFGPQMDERGIFGLPLQEICTTFAVAFLLRFVCLCTLLFIMLHYIPQTKPLGTAKIYFLICVTLVCIILFFRFIYLPKETGVTIPKGEILTQDWEIFNAFTYASLPLMIWRCMFYLHLFLLPSLLFI